MNVQHKAPEKIEISISDLALQISEREQKLEAAKQLSITYIRNAVILAIEQGKAMLQAELEFGEHWIEKLAQHHTMPEPGVAAGYMRLASKVGSIEELQDLPTYKQALLSCGLMPEPDPTEHAPTQRGVDTFLACVLKVRQSLANAISTLPIEKWEVSRRQMTKRELEPIVKVYEAL